jgi:hypothetical protein
MATGTKNMAYDHAAYIARLGHSFGINTAGASTAFSKFVAFTGLTIFSINANLVTAGTSTITAWNGSATTISLNGDSYSMIRVQNTAAAGATPAMSTATYGPYALSIYNGTATQTQTSVAGFTNYVPISGTGGIAAPTVAGGLSINQGDTIHIVRGIDATAVSGFTMEYGITPLANVTA